MWSKFKKNEKKCLSRPRKKIFFGLFLAYMLRFTQEILLALRAISNEEEAHEMSKKAREQFDFLGIRLVPRREVTYPIFDKYPPKDGDELVARVEDMWAQPYREIQYAACDYLFRHRALLGGQHLAFLKKLIKTRAWRDTVDTLAACVLGDLALRLPALRSKIASWIRDPNVWVRRSAIIFQIQYKDRTDWPLLRQFCLTCAKDDDYYIRNGIGRALSEYARINPTEVRRFVQDNTFAEQTAQEILRLI
jgi:3-methyladenine DNA glycosylase AlkD